MEKAVYDTIKIDKIWGNCERKQGIVYNKRRRFP
jgi:hypothetical protein